MPALIQPHRFGVGAINLLDDIDWHSAAWASDPLWTPPADGAAVSTWRGVNSRDFAQATGIAQPLFRASNAALGNRPGVEFDGTNDFLSTSSFATVPTPYSFVVVLQRGVTGGGGNERIIRANGQPCLLMNFPTVGKWGLFAGGAGLAGPNYDTAGHLIVGTNLGSTSSYISVDGSNTSGTHVGSDGVGDVQFARGAVEADYGAMVLAFGGFYAGDIAAHPNYATFKGHVASYYGLTIA